MTTPPDADPSRAPTARTSAASGLIARARRPAVRWGAVGPGQVVVPEPGAGGPPVTDAGDAGPADGTRDHPTLPSSARAASDATGRSGTPDQGPARPESATAGAGHSPTGPHRSGPTGVNVTERGLATHRTVTVDLASGVPSHDPAPPGQTPAGRSPADRPRPDPEHPAVPSPASGMPAAPDAGPPPALPSPAPGRRSSPQPAESLRGAESGSSATGTDPPRPVPPPAPGPVPIEGPRSTDMSTIGPWDLPSYGRSQDRPRADVLRQNQASAGPVGAASAAAGSPSPDVHIGQITVVTPAATPAAADPFGSVAHLRRGRPHHGGAS
jgi:hypothetical protein